MSASRNQQVPGGYQIRIAGHLDQHWSAWFGDLDLTREEDGTTSLTGAIADQAELHGLLAKIRDLGVTLISLTARDVVPRHGDDLAADRSVLEVAASAADEDEGPLRGEQPAL
jgi:hypothetical protein